jgi:hypothetical protein
MTPRRLHIRSYRGRGMPISRISGAVIGASSLTYLTCASCPASDPHEEEFEAAKYVNAEQFIRRQPLEPAVEIGTRILTALDASA